MEKKEYIKNRFKKILSENLESRADKLMERIKLNLDKEVPFSKPGKSFDYVKEREICSECGGYKGRGEMIEKDMCECGSMNENLKGGQKKLDVAKPYGKLTRDDFDQLRKGVKKHMKEYTMGDDDSETVKSYGDFSTDSPKKIGKVKNVGDRFQRKVSKKFDDYELEEEMEEGNKFSGELSKATKEGRKFFEVDGKTYPVKKNKVDETKYRIVSNGQSAIFTENEVIDIIENIVNEEKVKSNIKNQTVPKGYTEYERVHKEDKREEDKYFKDLAKKMKEYLKNGSKGKYEMNPKHFPVGNGELEEIEKMAFSLTDDNEDFNYQIAGLQIPVPDAIEFNDERMDKYYEGSSETGNAPGGNALESKANSRFNKFRKNQTLDKLKKQAYNKSPQPVFNEKSGQEKGEGIKIKLESIEDKKVISEIEIMRNLIGYNQKTQ